MESAGVFGMAIRGKRFFGSVAPLCCAITCSSVAHAASYQSLYSFKGGSDGAYPYAGLIAVGGTLYGTTGVGGGNGCNLNGCGTVFSFNPSTGTEAVTHSFVDNPDGSFPYAGLTYAIGTIYGTTGSGGLSEKGTVFSLNPTTRAESIIYSMPATSGPNDPQSNLIGSTGLLYGTSIAGGTKGLGTVYSVNSTTGIAKVIHSFSNAPAADPKAIISVNGIFYGTTQFGGDSTCTSGCGTVFSVNPKSRGYKVLYRFHGQSDGGNPSAGLVSVNGLLVGTTTLGFGGIFSVDPNTGREKVLYNFKGNGDATLASLINVGGVLYGTTKYGGAADSGTVFSFNQKSGTETVVYSFKGGSDGFNPISSLLSVGSTLYGTTFRGGIYSYGTVFSVTP
jgi:uncharacterized repeat protein (TIGR03803 family)